MLSLAPSEIRVWFLFCAEVSDAGLLSEYRLLLSTEERARQERFRFPLDRHRYLLTRALVRTVLSRYAPTPPEEWVFTTDRHGRPHIANLESSPAAANISFNISHTRQAVMLGVTSRSALGVDVEGTREQAASLELADRYFSISEASHLRALPIADRAARFFDYWTLKESYIKARGRGLSIPLDQFGFEFHGADVTLNVSPTLGDDARRWRFWLLKPSDDHVAAVCVDRPAIDDPTLIVNRIVPLREEKALEYELRDRSP